MKRRLMAEVDDLSLKQFVTIYPLPQVAKVTQGYCSDNDCDEYDFSTNEVLTVSRDTLLVFISQPCQ